MRPQYLMTTRLALLIAALAQLLASIAQLAGVLRPPG